MDFSSNISLSDGSRIQTIYASQLYGTFFGIFAKFDVSQTTFNGTKKSKYIEKIKFTLINFKGNLNLEIVGAGNIRKITDIKNLKGFTLDINVKHTDKSQPIQLYDAANPGPLVVDLMDVNKYKIKDSTDKDYIHSTKGVNVTSGEDYLRIERKIKSMQPLPLKTDKAGIAMSSVTNGVFDSEFYTRDGNFVILKDLFDFTKPDKSTPEYGMNVLMHGSTSCPPSNSKLFFD